MSKSKKKRLVPSAELGVNARREGVKSPAQRAPNEGPPVEGFAADAVKKLAKWAPKLGTDLGDVSGYSTHLPSDGIEPDANLQRAVDQSQANYQTANREPPMANSPAAAAEKLAKAIAEIDKALVKIRAGKAADQYARVERLTKARQACIQARDEILAKSDRDSAGTDAAFRARQTNESAAPGYSTAVAGIAKLQARQNRSRT
jgi:hypothetical protein